MRYEGIDWAFSFDMPAGARNILIWMLRRANNDGSDCYPGIPELMDKTGLSDRYIQKVLKSLERMGLIEILEGGRGGRGLKTVYQLHFEKAGADCKYGELNPELCDMLNPEPQFTLYTDKPRTMEQETPNSVTLNPELCDTALKERSNHKRISNREATPVPIENSETKTPKTPFEIPEGFEPITELSGYRNTNHQKSFDYIREMCAQAGVVLSDVVTAFVEYWPGGKIRHGWKDPVKSLRNTIEIQISKVLNRPSGALQSGPGVQPMKGKASHGNNDKYIQNAAEWDARRARRAARRDSV